MPSRTVEIPTDWNSSGYLDLQSVPSDWEDFPELYMWMSFIRERFHKKHGLGICFPDGFFDNITTSDLYKHRYAIQPLYDRRGVTAAQIALENEKIFVYKREFGDLLRTMMQLQADSRDKHPRSKAYQHLLLQHKLLADGLQRIVSEHKLIDLILDAEDYTCDSDLSNSWAHCGSPKEPEGETDLLLDCYTDSVVSLCFSSEVWSPSEYCDLDWDIIGNH